ncbi:MAG: AlpA family transcriptional regulator [Candidatus Thiodiazotropha sp. (ex Lucinoma aequizonata)]|nr:AlpA family transcriptional regulator [Candidatus Thiodiazotropha sp. (ex Lucinoma aequizonata)]MCU7887447.1 AlpA family transcriptional regulator [Candidatus Thiodiazotropha sp. (ex Lucinoma aequizonata)]MCU7895565.1 AlpA family transcriptional regulator [Candidatus Thiodiazotropha sp. (ex Lucinoma aequizonata)]MCU7898673.1 AlpA family transcriptional regulator [Candidatus Thiodiazotropha sp. (ex Lucinoma aequizonata)]MCU7902298.1 AlpA family transcriptional regulator [Candidatus Thiodiazot
MGVALYQRFTLNEASLFLRCPASDLQNLVDKKEIQYIQVSQTEIQLFGYQLLQHLLNNVIGNPPKVPAKQSNDTQDRILRAHEVQQIVGISRSTIWRLERKGQFPARLPLGTGSVGWLKSDIETWMQNRR